MFWETNAVYSENSTKHTLCGQRLDFKYFKARDTYTNQWTWLANYIFLYTSRQILGKELELPHGEILPPKYFMKIKYKLRGTSIYRLKAEW
jgi:hypothetical protein